MHWQKHLSHCPSAWNGPLSGIGEHVPNCSQGPGCDVEGRGVVFTSKTCTFKKKVILAQKNGSCLGDSAILTKVQPFYEDLIFENYNW